MLGEGRRFTGLEGGEEPFVLVEAVRGATQVNGVAAKDDEMVGRRGFGVHYMGNDMSCLARSPSIVAHYNLRLM